MQRQAIHQINIDGGKALLSCVIEYTQGFFLTLNAVDGFLHGRVEILHAHTHAIKAAFAQYTYSMLTAFTRIYFNTVFTGRIIRKVKTPMQMIRQPTHLLIV